jgi:hypothetical protein
MCCIAPRLFNLQIQFAMLVQKKSKTNFAIINVLFFMLSATFVLKPNAALALLTDDCRNDIRVAGAQSAEPSNEPVYLEAICGPGRVYSKINLSERYGNIDANLINALTVSDFQKSCGSIGTYFDPAFGSSRLTILTAYCKPTREPARRYTTSILDAFITVDKATYKLKWIIPR